jgi:hypothetical protein
MPDGYTIIPDGRAPPREGITDRPRKMVPSVDRGHPSDGGGHRSRVNGSHLRVRGSPVRGTGPSFNDMGTPKPMSGAPIWDEGLIHTGKWSRPCRTVYTSENFGKNGSRRRDLNPEEQAPSNMARSLIFSSKGSDPVSFFLTGALATSLRQ